MSADTTPPPLVDRDNMTAPWFTRTLRHVGILGEESVVSVRAAPIGTGQVADTLVFALTYDGPAVTAPASVVAKVSAADPDSRAVALSRRLYEREVRFYQQLAGRTNVTAPTHIYSDIDTDTGQFVLLLEDLSPASSVNQLAGFGVSHAKCAVLQAAALHAPLWGDSALSDLTWLGRTPAARESQAETTAGLIEAFCDRYSQSLSAEMTAQLRALSPYAARFWTTRRGPMTLIHGDFRPDNMLFDANCGQVPVAVVDWQTIDRGNGLLDIAFLLGTALDPQLRGSHEQELVTQYFDALVAAGVDDYDWQECWTDYRYFACYAVFMLAPAAMLVERTERGDAMFLAMIGRALAQIRDLGTEALLHGQEGDTKC